MQHQSRHGCEQGLGYTGSCSVSSQLHQLQVASLQIPVASRRFHHRSLSHKRLVCECVVRCGDTSTKDSRISTRNSKVERLRRWLKTLNIDECNLKVERCAQGSSGSGYGGFAGPGGVEKGSVIVRVPRKALMTEETAVQCQDVGPLVTRGNLTPWQAMCLHLLYERARGEASYWYPYISLLPTELECIGMHPMLWPQKMRHEWLEGSPMLEVTERRLAICREDHDAMLMAGAERLDPRRLAKAGFLSEASVRWAATMLLSRSFSLDLSDQHFRPGSFRDDTIALVPWADMLNHSSSAGRESCLVYDQKLGVASLQAHCTNVEGEQVYDSYGPSCSASTLLLDYGFVDEENTIHTVHLPASMLGPTNNTANASLLQMIGLPLDGAVFSLTPAGVDSSVMAWTRAAVASKEELALAGWKEAAGRSSGHPSAATVMYRFSTPVSRDNELEVLQRLLRTCEYLSNKYPTTYEQDAKILAASNNQHTMAIPWGRKQAARALMSEKLALRGAQKVIRESLSKIRAGIPLNYIYQ